MMPTSTASATTTRIAIESSGAAGDRLAGLPFGPLGAPSPPGGRPPAPIGERRRRPPPIDRPRGRCRSRPTRRARRRPGERGAPAGGRLRTTDRVPLGPRWATRSRSSGSRAGPPGRARRGPPRAGSRSAAGWRATGTSPGGRRPARPVPEGGHVRQDERPREELRSNAPFGDAERRVRAKLRLDREGLAPPPRCPEGGHLDPFAAPDRWQDRVDRFKVVVTDGDVASNAARGSIDAELDDRRGALLRLVGNDELDREPAEGGERKEEPGRERPKEQGGEHVEPARLDVRPDQEQDPRAEQQTDRALARAHGLRCLARRAAGRVPPGAGAR